METVICNVKGLAHDSRNECLLFSISITPIPPAYPRWLSITAVDFHVYKRFSDVVYY